MTTAGWVIMITSIGTVVSLLTYCFTKVLSAPESADHMHAPLDIDTQDLDT
ncbi:MAG: hypothetical protein ACPGXK_15005 [Phycisphaerae bacterium]